MNNKICLWIIIILLAFLNIFQFWYNNSEEILPNKIVKNNLKNSPHNLISIMIENENGTYEEPKEQDWSSNEYLFNEKLSSCENGSRITWNEASQKIEVTAASSDKCYAYFSRNTYVKKCELGLANADSAVCEILNQYGQNNDLIYHDGQADYETMPNANLEARDFSYRYTGANPDNYVCLDGISSEGICQNGDDNLYRIIGLFPNDDEYEMKLIKYDYTTKEQTGDNLVDGGASSGSIYDNETYYQGHNYSNIMGYYWNSSKGICGDDTCNENTNMWQYSNLNKINLNTIYYQYITEKEPNLAHYITKHNWQTGGYYDFTDAKIIYNKELGENKLSINDVNCYSENDKNTALKCTNDDLNYQDEIGLLYISDYIYAAYPEVWNNIVAYQEEKTHNNNWLYMGLWEWSISRMTTGSNIANDIVNTGELGGHAIFYGNRGIRPCFYLANNIRFASGDGTYEKPYRFL